MTEGKKNRTSAEKILTYIAGIVLMLLPAVILPLTGTKIVFYNNDDLYLQELVSGVMTGTPESHLNYIGYLTGLVLSNLYKILPAVPWYGLWLCVCFYGSILYTAVRLSGFLESRKARILFWAGASLVSYSFLWYHLIQLQYTTVTAVLAAAGIVTFICAKDSTDIKEYLRNNIPGFVFFGLAFELRNKACFMVLAVLVVLVIVKILQHKKMLQSLLAYMGIMIAMIALLSVVEKAAYASDKWQEFRRYNVARENLLDFKGYPSYDSYTEIYEQLGISSSAYNGAKHHYQLLLEENIDAEAFETLYALENREYHFKALLKDFIKLQYFSSDDYPLNILVYAIYVGAVLIAIFTHKKGVLWQVTGLFATRNVIWAYLVFGGRIVPWVTQGLYIMEAMVLLSILISNTVWQNETSKPLSRAYKLMPFVFGLGLAGCIFVGIVHMNAVVSQHKLKQIQADNYIELRTYCAGHAENIYLADVLSLYESNQYALDTEETWAANMVLLGGWPVKSPWSDRIADNYGIDSYYEAVCTSGNVYFIFKDTTSAGYEYLEEYLADKGGGSLEIADTFTTSHGERYLILQLGSETK